MGCRFWDNKESQTSMMRPEFGHFALKPAAKMNSKGNKKNMHNAVERLTF